MTLVPTCAVHCRALCDIGCTRGSVARDDASTDKCNFRYCLFGLPGVPKKVPVSPARAMTFGWTDFADVNTAVGFAWSCILAFYWFCIVRPKCRMMHSCLVSYFVFPFVAIYFWEKPLTAWMRFIHVEKSCYYVCLYLGIAVIFGCYHLSWKEVISSLFLDELERLLDDIYSSAEKLVFSLWIVSKWLDKA